MVAKDRIGAFCRHAHVEMKGASHGPLLGLTFAVKDIYDVAGHRTGFGSPDWLRTHGPATRTAPVVQRLLDAGAHLVGKTNTDELTWSLTGENAHYGAPVNVNAPERITGGSSSGSASAVAAGVVDFAVGSDTGGSVRLPASFCGILGMRPTYGRIPLDGVCPLAPSFDTCGWFACDAGVFERVGRTLLRDDTPAPAPGRLLIAQDALDVVGEMVADALRSALDKVAALVGTLEPVTVGDEPIARWMDYFRFLQGAEAWACHGQWITSEKPALGPGVKERFAWAPTVGLEDITRARARREEIARRMAEMLGGRAVLALPSAPGIALLRNSPPKVLDDLRARALPILCIAGLARLPQLSLPLAKLDGCPLGLSLIAARGNDTLLLELAGRLMG
ncbi:MAG: amidase [Deltaproteobacteria bacterium]|nr:MAG: amidase [Deltaproteobacteria bacterium]